MEKKVPVFLNAQIPYMRVVTVQITGKMRQRIPIVADGPGAEALGLFVKKKSFDGLR
jgi:hypothetical protein